MPKLHLILKNGGNNIDPNFVQIFARKKIAPPSFTPPPYIQTSVCMLHGGGTPRGGDRDAEDDVVVLLPGHQRLADPHEAVPWGGGGGGKGRTDSRHQIVLQMGIQREPKGGGDARQ